MRYRMLQPATGDDAAGANVERLRGVARRTSGRVGSLPRRRFLHALFDLLSGIAHRPADVFTDGEQEDETGEKCGEELGAEEFEETGAGGSMTSTSTWGIVGFEG